jgi:outer membrane lipoprotein carrier protein
MLLKPNVEMQMRSSRFQVFGAAWVAVQLAGLLVSGGAWAQGAAAPAAPAEAASKPAAAATKPAAGKSADGKAAAAAPATAKAAAKPAATKSPGATAAAPAAPRAIPEAASAAAAPARPPTAETVAKIQQVYEKTASLKAKFAQVMSGPMGKRQASGTVLLKKPGMMRWDYEKPEKKLFVADGTTLWVYEPEDEQAYKQPLSGSQLPAQVSFLFGRGKLSDEFDITYLDGQSLGEPGDLVLKLVPKVASAQYRYLVFVVSPSTFLVKETVLYDQQGGQNDIAFSAVEQNPKAGIDTARFQFTPPANTKIINAGR